MEAFFAFVSLHIFWAPFLIFFALILAGFNIPISEDAMIFITAYLAAEHPGHLLPLFTGLFLGAYLSDLISYYLGRHFGHHIFRISFFKKLRDSGKITKITHLYEKYGMLTLILGRLVPFGVRNTLFLTAGIIHVRPIKFITADLVAAIISITGYFYIYYRFGHDAIMYVKKGNLIIFGIFAVLIFIFIFWLKKHSSKHNE